MAWIALAWIPVSDVMFGWSENPTKSLAQATELAERARTLDESWPDTYTLLGRIHGLKGEHEKAVELSEKAISLNPNHSMNLAMLASTLNRAGRSEEAIGAMKKAMRLSPFPPPWYPFIFIRSYLVTGRYDEMIPLAEEFVKRNVGFATLNTHGYLAFAYAELGRHESAKLHIAKVLELDPDYTLENVKATTKRQFKDQAFWARYIDGLRKLGLPE